MSTCRICPSSFLSPTAIPDSSLQWVHIDCINVWVNKADDATHRSCKICLVCYRLSLPALPWPHELLAEIDRKLGSRLPTILFFILLWFYNFERFGPDVFLSFGEIARAATYYTLPRFLASLYFVRFQAIFTYAVAFLDEEPNGRFREFLLRSVSGYFPAFLRERITDPEFRLPPVKTSLVGLQRWILVVCWLAFELNARRLEGLALFLASVFWLPVSLWHSYAIFTRNVSVTVLPFEDDDDNTNVYIEASYVY